MSDATSGGDALALAGDTLRQGMVDRMRTILGADMLDHLLKPNDDLWIRVSTSAWRRAGFAVRDELGCDYFGFVSGMDWLPSPFGRSEDDPTQPAPERDMTIRQGYTGGDTRMQVLARVVNTRLHVGVTLKVDVPDEGPGAGVVESWVPVYAGANWHERETHEMYGITFSGHNDLRNLYLPTDFEGYPMRKDFPLLARLVKPWPGIVDVEPLPGEPDDAEPSEAGSAE